MEIEGKWKRSLEMRERACAWLAGGVSSPFRAHFPVPLYFEDGWGARLKDVDGNEYIDYALAWGPAILGHRHPGIAEAVAREARRPLIYGAQHHLEPEVAEKLHRAAPCAERVAFTSSGSEAVQLAMRLARAATGRTLIVKFEGHYHGWMDSALLSYRAAPESLGPVDSPVVALGSRGQVPNAADNVLAVPWNDVEALRRLFARRGKEIAAVIAEPVLVNSGCLMPEPGYLAALAGTAREHGALVIFDEIITGFRMAKGTAQNQYGVTPDLATFGKAIGGGMPLSVVAGRADIMELMFAGVAFGGTFNGNPMSLAAANVALDELMRDGWALLVKVNRTGERLMAGLAELGERLGVALTVCGFGAAFSMHFTSRKHLRHYRDTFEDDKERLAAYIRGMLEEGIYLLPDGRMYVSCAHGEVEIASTLEAAGRVLGRLG